MGNVGLYIGIALGSIIPLILIVVMARSAFLALRRRPWVWLALGLAGAGLGAWMGYRQVQVVRKAQPHDFDVARGEEACNFRHCDRPPAGSVEWQETWTYRTESSTSTTPGAVLNMRFCDRHLGLGPGDFTYHLNAPFAIGGWTILGTLGACAIAWFFTRAPAPAGSG